MNFMQNRHILPVRSKKRCLFPKEDGTPEATGASRGEKRTESGSLAGPYDVHRLSGKWGRCPIFAYFLYKFRDCSLIIRDRNCIIGIG